MFTKNISSNFFYLLSLLFHFGCFTLSNSRHHHHHPTSSFLNKKRTPPTTTTTTVFSYLKRLFSCSSSAANHIIPPPPPSIPSPSSSTRSLRVNPPLISPLNDTNSIMNIHPCTICGEVFLTAAFLHQHQSTKHAVSDLVDGDNILRIIFKMGWPEKAKPPTIHRILKIHNSPKVLARFEDHRHRVKAKAAESASEESRIKNSRCAADGNELLRFYCTTFTCALDSAACTHQFCGACAIIRCGFSHKLDGIPTLPTSWKAHAAVPEEIEEEFSFMHLKRAMLVCRVIAGRVGSDPTLSDKADGLGFDSLVGPATGGVSDDELLVFSPRGLLPCFIIVYTL